MFLLISEDPALVARMRRIIGASLVEVRSTIPTAKRMRTMFAAIVSLSRPDRHRNADLLREIGERSPHVVRIAMVPVRRAEIQLACRAGANDIVFEDSIEDGLAETLRRFDSHWHHARRPVDCDVRHELARTILHGSAHSPFLRNVISSALCSPVLPRTVQELAIFCHRPRSTLQYHWRREISSKGGPTLHRFLNWILLLHATESSHHCSTLAALAHELRVEPKTLRSACLRLVGDWPTLRAAGSIAIARKLRSELTMLGEKALKLDDSHSSFG